MRFFQNGLVWDKFYLPSDARKIQRCRKQATSLGIDKDGTSSQDHERL